MPQKAIENVSECHIKKRAMIEALTKCLGVVTTAALKVGIATKTHYRWMESDSEYKQEVLDIADTALDFVESHLFKKVKSGDTTACIFYLKTKGKKRGYVEKNQLEVTMPEYNGLFKGVRRPEKPVDNIEMPDA